MAKKSIKVITPAFRVSFPEIREPKAFKAGDTPKFSVTMLIPKDPESYEYPEDLREDCIGGIDTIQAAFDDVKMEAFGDKKIKGFKDPIKDGDEEDYDGNRGYWVVRASSKDRPGMVDAAKNPILDAGELYAGCWARASINLYDFNFENVNKGISVGLNNIQMLADGERFSGRKAAEDDFDAVDADFDDL